MGIRTNLEPPNSNRTLVCLTSVRLESEGSRLIGTYHSWIFAFPFTIRILILWRGMFSRSMMIIKYLFRYLENRGQTHLYDFSYLLSFTVWLYYACYVDSIWVSILTFSRSVISKKPIQIDYLLTSNVDFRTNYKAIYVCLSLSVTFLIHVMRTI